MTDVLILPIESSEKAIGERVMLLSAAVDRNTGPNKSYPRKLVRELTSARTALIEFLAHDAKMARLARG